MYIYIIIKEEKRVLSTIYAVCIICGESDVTSSIAYVTWFEFSMMARLVLVHACIILILTLVL